MPIKRKTSLRAARFFVETKDYPAKGEGLFTLYRGFLMENLGFYEILCGPGPAFEAGNNENP